MGKTAGWPETGDLFPALASVPVNDETVGCLLQPDPNGTDVACLRPGLAPKPIPVSSAAYMIVN